jgi:hypothetical protein
MDCCVNERREQLLVPAWRFPTPEECSKLSVSGFAKLARLLEEYGIQDFKFL